MIVEHDVLDAERRADLLRLRPPSRGQRAAALRLVTGVAVGHRDESHLVAERRPLRRRAAGADVAIVRVGAERDDAKRGLRLAVRGYDQSDEHQQGGDDHTHRKPPGGSDRDAASQGRTAGPMGARSTADMLRAGGVKDAEHGLGIRVRDDDRRGNDRAAAAHATGDA